MNEIRIEISSEITGANPSILVNLVKSTVPAFTGTRVKEQIYMTREELMRIRSKPAKKDSPFLYKLGEQIRKSLGDKIMDKIQAILDLHPEEKFRIVIIIHDSAVREISQDVVRPDEIPIELLTDTQNKFLSLNPKTPIVRGISTEPDRETKNIVLPLKILVVVSTPIDKPPSSMEEEKEVIEKCLADGNSDTRGKFLINWCIPATKKEFRRILSEFNPSIVHFIGHGGFDIPQEGGVPQGYLSFMQESDGNHDDMTADDLAVSLTSTGTVDLFVLTSCSSAKPKDGDLAATYDTYLNKQYNPFAFEGVAQKLIAGSSGVTAVVAMQFDIEVPAAVEFTRRFYEELVKTDVTIEEAVTQARIAVRLAMGEGHPAWVTPVLFSRSINGILFRLQNVLIELSPEERSKLNDLESEIRTYKRIADGYRVRISTIPLDMQDPVKDLLTGVLENIDNAERQRSALLGDSVRIHGLRTQKNVDIELPVTLNIRSPIHVDRIQFDIQYPADVLLNAQIREGKDTPTIVPALARQDVNTIRVFVIWPADKSAEFNKGEFEIAKLGFHVSQTAPSGFTDIKLSDIGIYYKNKLIGNRGMFQSLFLEDKLT